jgi:hypothetical protein
MLQAFLPASATRVVVYLKPVNMRLTPKKLRALCTETIGIEPDSRTAFLFTNKSQDFLLMFFEDETGDQSLIKKLNKGAFLLPAADRDGAEYVIMKPAILPRLFRSSPLN